MPTLALRTALLTLNSTMAALLPGEPIGPSGIAVEAVVGPESPAPYKHPASITELQSGDLFLVYYGGEGEYARDTAVYGMRKARNAPTWAPPGVISDTPFHSEGNAVVWQAPSGLVWLFHVTRYGETWSSSRIVARISRDGAATWSDTFYLTFEEGLMVRGRPIVLASGDYLLPVYRETGADPERVGPDTCSFFLRFDPHTERWSETNRVYSRIGNLQPAVAALTDERLVAYCRRGGGYEPTEDAYLVRTESRDGGRTWTRGEESGFPNPNAAVDLLRLQSGHLLLIFNDSKVDRTPLTAALSEDGDRSYPYRRNIAEGPGDFAYPYAIQARDGKIHLVFTSDERTVVRHAVFDEEAIRHTAAGKDLREGAGAGGTTK